ncbi:MAG: heavy metal translocating P-type ATPase, partial [Myxococcota bacterium]
MNAASPLPLRCAHCAAPVESGEFCCAGCETAAEIIRGAGLERYYAERAAPAPRPGPAAAAWSQVPVEPGEDGAVAVTLRVDGLTCAACAWVTERVLRATPGVRSATVSLASGRTRVEWDPGEVDLDGIAGRIAAIGYRPRAAGALAPPDRTLLVRLGVAAFVAMNVMLMSASIYAGWLDGMDERHAALFRWVSLALATPSALWCAEPMLRAAWTGLRHRILHVDLPVSIGIVAMYGHAIVATVRGEDAWLDSLTMLVALLLAGRVAEQGGRRRAVEAATALAGTAPASARTEAGRTVPAASLARGDRIVVATGEEIAADGVVVDGRGTVRMALLTGEAEPASVAVGDRVVAGAVLEEGPLVVRVEAAGEGTLVARMAAELAKAADRPAPPALTDRIAPWFTAVTLVAAGAALVGWGVVAGWGEGADVAMAVLVVACPCA